jgi:hypothetical protein
MIQIKVVLNNKVVIKLVLNNFHADKSHIKLCHTTHFLVLHTHDILHIIDQTSTYKSHIKNLVLFASPH